MQALSAIIISLNAGNVLDACLQSLHFVDEIVVVDSGSTDDTLAIAQRHGCRVIQQDWLGFGPQKQFAVEQAKHDWVLCIDCDERISPMLRQSIQACLQVPDEQAWQMPRSNRFMGRYLKHGEGYPDWSLRLFNRQHAAWSDDAVHEKVLFSGIPGRLQGDLLHESGEDISVYLSKQNRYTSLQAEILFRKGKQASAATLLLSPVLRFIKFYVFRRGFLDGIPGLVHIAIGCFNSFSKYAKLMEMQRLRESR